MVECQFQGRTCIDDEWQNLEVEADDSGD